VLFERARDRGVRALIGAHGARAASRRAGLEPPPATPLRHGRTSLSAVVRAMAESCEPSS
jgi:hypothetical protein